MSEDEDEDWFERALHEEPPPDEPEDWEDWAGDREFEGPLRAPDTSEQSVDDGPDGDAASGADGDAASGADGDAASGADGDAASGADGDAASGADGDAASGADGDAASGADDEGPGGDRDDSGAAPVAGGGASAQADDESLFEDDFASAMGGTPDVDFDPDDDAGGEGAGTGGGDLGMSGGDLDVGGGGGEFGMGGGEEFGMGGGEFDMGGGGGEFGMGGGGGGFDEEEEYDSDLDRIDLGITGLDEMIQGGVPERSLMVTIGSAGTGKTTFALQFLHHALEQGERGIYITLEESREHVIKSATEKGLAYDEYADDGQLAVVDLDPVEMANSLRSIRSELPRLIEAFDATRLVLDSVSLLEMMYDDRAKRRNEIYDFTRSLKNAGVTTMLTSEASDENAYTSRHGIVEYLTDAVFILQYVRPDDFRETRLAIEIQKIRDANHSRETKPYEITNDGLSVYGQANIF